MGCLISALLEWKVIQSIASPGYVIHLLDRSFWISTLIFLGQHGKGNLATGLMAISTLNIPLYFMEGLLSAQDIFLFQSQSREKAEKMWLFISLAYVVLCCVLTAGLVVLFDLYLYDLLSLKRNVTFKTMVFLWLLVPVVFLHGLQRVLQQYLTVKSLYIPVCISLLLGFICNVIGSSLMFYTNIGPLGCAVSIAAAKLVTASALFFYSNQHTNKFLVEVNSTARLLFRKTKYLSREFWRLCLSPKRSNRSDNVETNKPKQSHVVPDEHDNLIEEDAPPKTEGAPFNRKRSRSIVTHDDAGIELTTIEEGKRERYEADETEDSRPLLDSKHNASMSRTKTKFSAKKAINDALKFGIIGFPGGIFLVVDMVPFELVCLLVAHMGTIAMDTHQMLFLLVQSMCITLLLPWSTATTIRIQTLFQLNQSNNAKIVAWMSILYGSLLTLILALILFSLRNYLGYIFSNNMDIIRRTESMTWFAALFLIPFGAQITLKGVLRATSYQIDMISFQFVTVWLIGCPVGLYLAFYARPTFGLQGLWMGLSIGQTLFASILLLQFLLIDWNVESNKFNYRLKRYMLAKEGKTPNNLYLNDIALPNVANISIGGFQIRTKTLDEELDELEMTELVSNPLMTGNNEDADELMDQ